MKHSTAPTGKLVLIVFWKSSTITSRNGETLLANIYSKYNEKGLAIIGINLDP